ncbi:MAG: MmcB family DNA repair protein [Helicobacteraceae bacterium]|jgi:hypothetical protein|nr:MmcB family DNA repair protein [Helicobacteraceae bacterium]
MTDKETTEIIYKRLEIYFNNRDWAYEKEIRVGTGFKRLSQRRIDFLAISTRNGNDVIGIEIKASRGDYKKDIQDTEKQKALRCFCNDFYYAAPAGLIEKNELPAWAGLIEVRTDADKYKSYSDKYFEDGDGVLAGYIRFTIAAPHLHNNPPTWGLVAEIIRKYKKGER